MCDADYTVTFTRKAVIVRNKQVTAVLTVLRESKGPQLWQIDLQPGESNPAQYAQQCQTGYIVGI